MFRLIYYPPHSVDKCRSLEASRGSPSFILSYNLSSFSLRSLSSSFRIASWKHEFDILNQ